MCPSREHPAADRIPLDDVPQFILFTVRAVGGPGFVGQGREVAVETPARCQCGSRPLSHPDATAAWRRRRQRSPPPLCPAGGLPPSAPAAARRRHHVEHRPVHARGLRWPLQPVSGDGRGTAGAWPVPRRRRRRCPSALTECGTAARTLPACAATAAPSLPRCSPWSATPVSAGSRVRAGGRRQRRGQGDGGLLPCLIPFLPPPPASDCDLAYKMWQDGYEIADHTGGWHWGRQGLHLHQGRSRRQLGCRAWRCRPVVPPPTTRRPLPCLPCPGPQ